MGLQQVGRLHHEIGQEVRRRKLEMVPRGLERENDTDFDIEDYLPIPTYEDALESYKEATKTKGRSVALSRVCAEDIAGIFASFGMSASFLSAAVTECQGLFEQEVY